MNWLMRLFKRKPKRNFPKFAESQCHGALNEAEAIIRRLGQHKVTAADVTVRFVPGTRKFGRDWAWHVEGKNYTGYVLGLCSGNGNTVQIGIDPARQTDPAAVNRETLIHEFAHHWLSRHNFSHHPAYDGLIPGWKSAREIVGKLK